MVAVKDLRENHEGESTYEVNQFDSLRVSLASPERIRAWSHGEVKKPETINYRTLKPERDGLFCEKIFGPTKDWECRCGKYKRIRYKGIVCERCGVEVTLSKVRRERMGHIELAAPVSHIWYFKGIPSRLGLLLDMSPRDLEKVLYFAAYVVVDPGETSLLDRQILSESEYRDARDKFGEQFQAGMGAEAVKTLLSHVDLDEMSRDLREEIKEASSQKRVRSVRRLEVVEAFRRSGNHPSWMILEVVPVIPPELRPMVQLDGGRFATSDLNDLYRRVINRNNRLKRLLDLGAPDIIVRNEKRMLQEAVDALIDNGRRGRPVTGPGNRPLKSLSDLLKGKQGRFRQNLLGKRVDYSGRSVIVVGPELKLNQCGLPKEMALELFKPFVMKELVARELTQNIKSAKRMVDRGRDEVWDVLADVIREHPVMLNRAPTLHRLGIQAFEPVLVEGKAIKIHPLVCAAYNADFDGDQMAVHVPLSAEAQSEARILMMASDHMLNPKDGRPVATPTLDMIFGIYYLTVSPADLDTIDPREIPTFNSVDEMTMAMENGYVKLHDPIKIRVKGAAHVTTPGRVILNEAFPENMPFVNERVDSRNLGDLVAESYRRFGVRDTSEMLDALKHLGFTYATRAGLTIAVSDIEVPVEKAPILEEAQSRVDEVAEQFRQGLLSEEERYERIIEIWTKAKDTLTGRLMQNMARDNPVYMMAESGARGNEQQIVQMAGMRGLMADPSGRTIEQPVRSNFREGLTVIEYFTSTHGTRKGLADTALRTAQSGYLTRRLVDVNQDVMVREKDCGTDEYVLVDAIYDGNEVIESLADRVLGRLAARDIVDPSDGSVLVGKDEIVDEDVAPVIERLKAEYGDDFEVPMRSVLTCNTQHGVCSHCYGRDLATLRLVDVGEAVGIIAAESIGEPGTQMTMRTFHTGGIAGDDITQGLPRVEELFEGRNPKIAALLADRDGTVSFDTTRSGKRSIVITTEDGNAGRQTVPEGLPITVSEGDKVMAGQAITEGVINPHDLLKIKGPESVYQHLLAEVQRVYRMQGVVINDKHIEIVIRQMLRKVRVINSGDTDLLPGSQIELPRLEEANRKIEEDGGEPATAEPVLLGITKASLATDSFLSAASFQETTRVLTQAATEGAQDHLRGLKENVIIGKLIPAGTGMQRYNEIGIAAVWDGADEDEEEELPAADSEN
ncbi:MAG: DNA-directed RNA polymerase subunit beta' [Clostridia bacterium]